MSCCPAECAPYLASDYNHKGAVEILGGGVVDIYAAGVLYERGLIIIPDIWGWNGGRTRNIADFYADRGYCVVVPKILVPAMGEGTDGDACPPEYKPDATFMPFMQTFSWDGSFKPKIAACIEHLVSKGCKKIGMIGFCFGGWVVCRTIADKDIGSVIVGGCSPHPSIQLEQFAWGGDVAALCAAVDKPVLFLPAGGDSPDYDKGGKWLPPLGESVRYPDQVHGWVPRGDLGDAACAAAVKSALEQMGEFLDKIC